MHTITQYRNLLIVWSLLLAGVIGCQPSGSQRPAAAIPADQKANAATQTDLGKESEDIDMVKKVVRTDKEWKELLTPEQYKVLRKKGTERAFTGEYNDHKEEGLYVCAGCGAPLFDSDTKYNSGSGWPSFWRPVSDAALQTADDRTLWMKRTEIVCNTCGGHLGHVFEDGPQPTGLRYCVNSVALDFSKEKDEE